MKNTSKEVYSWLNKKIDSRENGVFLDTNDFDSFDLIQNVLELKDHPYKTPAIYYQAFADEQLPDLISTIEEELKGKLGYRRTSSCSTMYELIALSELRTVVIDSSYLYSLKIIDGLWKWLSEYQIGLILVGSQAKMQGSPILNHPVISQWERFAVDSDLIGILISGYSNLAG